MTRVKFRGKTFTGSGEASSFTNLHWFKEFVRNKFGFDVYPGTLNLRAAESSDISILESMHASRYAYILESPDPHFCSAKLFPAQLGENTLGAVVIPEIKRYPKDVCEIVSNVNLRAQLSIA